MQKSAPESSISGKAFVVLFIIFMLVITFLFYEFRAARLREQDEREQSTPAPTEPLFGSLLEESAWNA